jgi:hypothetical protein
MQLAFGLSHLRIRHGRASSGIGLDLGAVDGHVTQLDQSGLLTQL